MMNRKIRSLVVTLAVAGSYLVAAPAQAALPPPTASDCGASHSKSVSGNTVTISFTYKCSTSKAKPYAIAHSVTIWRDGGSAFIHDWKECRGVYTCTKSWTFTSASGTQHYNANDDIYMIDSNAEYRMVQRYAFGFYA